MAFNVRAMPRPRVPRLFKAPPPSHVCPSSPAPRLAPSLHPVPSPTRRLSRAPPPDSPLGSAAGANRPDQELRVDEPRLGSCFLFLEVHWFVVATLEPELAAWASAVDRYLAAPLPSPPRWALPRGPEPLLYPVRYSPEPLDAQVSGDLAAPSSAVGRPSSKSSHLRPSPSLVSMYLRSPQSPLSILHMIQAPSYAEPRHLETHRAPIRHDLPMRVSPEEEDDPLFFV
jgi:hypothetical protein